MKLIRYAALVAAPVCLALASPAQAASEWPLEPNDYVQVSMIKIDDGYSLEYAKHLAGAWRKSQDFAKAQGWITGYEIMENTYPREGEPDIYLIVRFAKFADAAEGKKRDEAYRAYMAKTESQMQAESGARAKYRKLAGSMLLRELVWSK